MALTYEQNRFLAERLLSNTDTQAASNAGISRLSTIADWKREQPEFQAAYEALGSDGVELARSIMRQGLSKAALTLLNSLDATIKGKPDNTARIQAAKALLASHGISTDRNTLAGDPEAPIRQVIELIDKTAPKPEV